MTVDQFQGLQPGEDFNPLDNPELANAFGRMAMGEDEEEKPVSLITSPPDGTVTLPGGWLSERGLWRDATVRELNGEDEEELSRPGIARDFIKLMDTLLQRCVETIGGEKATRAMLDDLLIGDREMLIQGIRVATYGDVMRLDIRCPHTGCDAKFQVDYTFSVDVPIRPFADREVKLEGIERPIRLDPQRYVYTLPLRKGHMADVRLINGGIQRRIYTAENNDRTAAELNTLLLNECVVSIDGMRMTLAEIRRMPSADRLRILQFLAESQPGPQWGEVKHSCPRCEREFPLVIDVETMFRGG